MVAHGLWRWSSRALWITGPYVCLVLAWLLVDAVADIPNYLLPSPQQVYHALRDGLSSGDYLPHIWATLSETLLGFGIAAAIGVTLAVIVTESQFVDRAVYPLLVGLQSLPKIAVAPLILIWAGYGTSSKVITAALVALFPMLVNSITGLRGYDPDMAELFASLRAGRWRTLQLLKMRAAIPSLVAGLKVCFVFSMLGAIVGEFVGGKTGLGYLLIQLQFQLDTGGVFAILILLSAIGIIGERLIGWLGARLAFWQ